MAKERDTLSILKFACLSFTTYEYFEYAQEELIELFEEGLKQKYLNIEPKPNRSKRNKIERAIAKQVKDYDKELTNWKIMLRKLSESFTNDPKHEQTYDLAVDLIHRTMDQFKISDDEVVRDEFKDYYFQSLDKLKPKERTSQELLKLKASLDNYLTINKLI